MKKRKKYNALQSMKRVAQAHLNDCVITFTSGDNFKRLYSLKHGSQVRVTPQLNEVIHGIRWPWTVYIAAFGRDAFGKFYIKARELAVNGEHLYEEIAEYLNKAHADLIQETMPESQLVGVGWIAAPRRCAFDEQQAAYIFERLGADQ